MQVKIKVEDSLDHTIWIIASFHSNIFEEKLHDFNNSNQELL